MRSSAMQNTSMAALWALILSNFAYMADLAIIPAYAELYEHFASAPIEIVNFIASGSQLTLILGCLVSPALMRFVPKKRIVVVACALFTIVSVCTGLVDDALYVAVMRGVSGLFMGVIYPTASAIVIEMFGDDDWKRARYLGWFDGSMPGVGAVLLVASGFLLMLGWQAIFDVFWVGVPITVMLAVFLPSTPPDASRGSSTAGAQDAELQGEASIDKPFRLGKLAAIFVSFTLCNMFYGGLVYEFSMYLAENFTIPAYMNGLLGAIKGVSGAVMGFFVFAPLFAKLKRRTIALCFGAQALAYFGLMIILPGVPGVLWFLLCYSFIGVAFGLSVPYYYSYTSMVFPKKSMTLVTSAISVAFSLGAFLSTYFVTLLQQVFGLATYTQVLPYLGACCVAGCVLALVAGRFDPDRHSAFAGLDNRRM